jgi:dephospho-CoA kinase
MLTKPDGLRVWGLTGGIGAGKSVVARTWRALGIPVVDADQVSRDQMLPGGSAFAAVVAQFGPGIVAADGQVDRTALADIVFRDPAQRQRLEALTHGEVLREVGRRLDVLAQAGCGLAVVEAALIVEAGLRNDLDGLVAVLAPVDDRVRRVVARDSMDESAVRARMAAQVTDTQRRATATTVLENDGELDALRHKARAIAIGMVLEGGPTSSRGR